MGVTVVPTSGWEDKGSQLWKELRTALAREEGLVLPAAALFSLQLFEGWGE